MKHLNRLTGSKTLSAVLAAIAATALPACGGSSNSSVPDPTQTPEFRAQIRRTEFGIPHITAADEKGLGYGVGYAYAEDNFCLLAEAAVTVKGERSKFFGPSGGFSVGGATIPNLPSDIYYKVVNDADLVQTSWSNQPAEMKALMQGYVAGVNRYMKDVGPSGLPTECQGKPWVREITTDDMMRLVRHFAMQENWGTLLRGMYSAAAGPSAVASDSQTRAALAAEAAERQKVHFGSNGVALGSDATESGKGLLLANPHFPWISFIRFYQLHITIPGKVDAMGASLSGLPLVHVGFNKDVAWTHTVTESGHATRYEITLDPQDPTKYLVDGKARTLSKKTLGITVADGHGGTVEMTHPVYMTEYGPVIEWGKGKAYAYRAANMTNDRMMAQWWSMDQAKSVDDLKASLERYVGTPWVQTIATEKSGRVLYANITPVPNVPESKLSSCVAAGWEGYAASGNLVLNGNKADCAWAEEAGAPQAGIVPGTKLPVLIRTDYVQNSNDSSWLTNASKPLTGFPAIVSPEGGQQSGRTRIGLEQIATRLAGNDGYGGNRFNPTNLQAIAFSNKSHSATHLLSDLRTACVGATTATSFAKETVDIAKACSVLGSWDGTAELTSVGWPLYEAWMKAMTSSDNSEAPDFWSVPFDVKDPVHTPRGLRLADPKVKSATLSALAQAVSGLNADGMDFTKPWGQLQVAVRGTKKIPMHGGGSDDIYNYIVGEKIPGGQLNATFGSSIVLTVSFEGDSPKVQGFLTYSQSTNPASPYYADQTERFSVKRWSNVPFTEAAIATDPKMTGKVISE